VLDLRVIFVRRRGVRVEPSSDLSPQFETGAQGTIMTTQKLAAKPTTLAGRIGAALVLAYPLAPLGVHAQTMPAAAETPATTGMSSNPCPPTSDRPQSREATFQRLIAPRDPSLPPASPGNAAAAAATPAASAAPVPAAAPAQPRAEDFGLCRYAAENALVTGRPRAVFIGDSITDFWALTNDGTFSSEVLNRGISGQTSAQMLVRFYADVIALNPRAVHILAGTNDIAGNGGPTSESRYKNNIMAMSELAQVHGIKVVLGSIPPASLFPWRTDYRPAEKVRELNTWLRDYAQRNGFTYVDYYSVLTTPEGGSDRRLSNDGVHPNANGYAAMRPLALRAIQ
jgi:lysophospholipase L1-like esterase